MPLMRQKDRVRQNDCPDVESLYAFTEDRVRGVVRNAIATHLLECSRCADLHARLINFATPAAPEDELEWINTEKRLENWMEGFLRTHPSTTRGELSTETTLAGSRFGPYWKRFSPWKLQWALVSAAGLALLAGAVLFLRVSPPLHRTEPQVAVQTNRPMERQTTPLSGEKQTESQANDSAAKAAPENRVGTPAGSTASAVPAESGAEVKPSNKQGIPRQAERKESENALNSPAVPLQGTNGQGAETVIARASPAPDAPARPSSGRPAPPTAAGSPTTHAHTVSSGGVAGFAGGLLGTDAAKSQPIDGISPVPTGAKPLVGVAADRPASFRIEAGARIWIKRSSITPERDGTFPIRGTLHRPIMQAGTILLDQGTYVAGLETVDQGKTSLVVVTKFVVQGMSYVLKSASGAIAAPTPGGGGIVPFDGGQVLELFYAADSEYQQTPVARPSSGSAQAVWLGFANETSPQDREAELRKNCGDFKRVFVPHDAGNKFTDLCRHEGKTCEKVCDWEGNSFSCSAVSLGRPRDGSRIALCR